MSGKEHLFSEILSGIDVGICGLKDGKQKNVITLLDGYFFNYFRSKDGKDRPVRIH